MVRKLEATRAGHRIPQQQMAGESLTGEPYAIGRVDIPEEHVVVVIGGENGAATPSKDPGLEQIGVSVQGRADGPGETKSL